MPRGVGGERVARGRAVAAPRPPRGVPGERGDGRYQQHRHHERDEHDAERDRETDLGEERHAGQEQGSERPRENHRGGGHRRPGVLDAARGGPDARSSPRLPYGSTARTSGTSTTRPSADTRGGSGAATPGVFARRATKAATCAGGAEPRRYTSVGLSAPAGKPVFRSWYARVASVPPGSCPIGSKSGLNVSTPDASAPSSATDATITTPGRRATTRPTAANRVARGARSAERDGQNTHRPSTVTTAGTRVSAAASMTATPIARAGPSVVKNPSVASTSAPNAAITANAADAIASPTRSTAATTASAGSSPARRRSRYRNNRNSR